MSNGRSDKYLNNHPIKLMNKMKKLCLSFPSALSPRVWSSPDLSLFLFFIQYWDLFVFPPSVERDNCIYSFSSDICLDSFFITQAHFYSPFAHSEIPLESTPVLIKVCKHYSSHHRHTSTVPLITSSQGKSHSSQGQKHFQLTMSTQFAPPQMHMHYPTHHVPNAREGQTGHKS